MNQMTDHIVERNQQLHRDLYMLLSPSTMPAAAAEVGPDSPARLPDQKPKRSGFGGAREQAVAPGKAPQQLRSAVPHVPQPPLAKPHGLRQHVARPPAKAAAPGARGSTGRPASAVAATAGISLRRKQPTPPKALEDAAAARHSSSRVASPAPPRPESALSSGGGSTAPQRAASLAEVLARKEAESGALRQQVAQLRGQLEERQLQEQHQRLQLAEAREEVQRLKQALRDRDLSAKVTAPALRLWGGGEALLACSSGCVPPASRRRTPQQAAGWP
jgi:hypothetical protein